MEKEKTYDVWAVRSGVSIFDHAEAWCKENGKPLEFDTKCYSAFYKWLNSTLFLQNNQSPDTK